MELKALDIYICANQLQHKSSCKREPARKWMGEGGEEGDEETETFFPSKV